jgi:hypothetical protein
MLISTWSSIEPEVISETPTSYTGKGSRANNGVSDSHKTTLSQDAGHQIRRSLSPHTSVEWRPIISFLSDVYLCKNRSMSQSIHRTEHHPHHPSIYLLVGFHFTDTDSILLLGVGIGHRRSRVGLAFHPLAHSTLHFPITLVGMLTRGSHNIASSVFLRFSCVCLEHTNPQTLHCCVCYGSIDYTTSG